MSRNATEFHNSFSTPPLPADHVLNSGAVTFPGAFDQQGNPLVVFPVEELGKLSSDLKKQEVVDFINYFLRLHNKYQEKESLVSVIIDLRQATLTTTRFVAETLQLLESKRTVHTLYVVQPKKKDVLKLLVKLVASSCWKRKVLAPFKRLFLKDVSELCSYIDRSQLTASLGGYFVYHHRSWVEFIKEIDGFVQEFLSVVQRLPSCISTLQRLSHHTVPSGFQELKDFCAFNEARFHQMRRELGLDELQRHCERIVEKLRYPDNEPCYQAMAGTALFTHTAYDMLQNYSRITAAVEKVELLWQQAFSRAHLQLQVLSLWNKGQQVVWITEPAGLERRLLGQIIQLMNSITHEKLEPYRIEMAEDARKAECLKLEFEASIYTPGMALVRRAEGVIHDLAELVLSGDAQGNWAEELDHVKEKFRTAVELPHQTLRAVSDFYHFYNKAKSWYHTVLYENFFQDLLWSGSCDGVPRLRCPQEARGFVDAPWKLGVRNFLRMYPSPEMEELVQLAHLANVIPDATLQQTGKQLSHRCMILRKLLTSPGAVPLHDLQQALQWQYEILRSSRQDVTCPDLMERNCAETACGLPGEDERVGHISDVSCKQRLAASCRPHTQNTWAPKRETRGLHHKTSSCYVVPGTISTSRKPPSLSSFDSGFDGTGSGYVDVGVGRECWEGLTRSQCTREPFRPVARQPQIHEENIASVSDSEDQRAEFGAVRTSSRASIQIIPKMTDSLNFEIKVKRSATVPSNPWLSLPVEDLESSYTVTITPNTQCSQCEPDQSQKSRCVGVREPGERSLRTEKRGSAQMLSTGEERPASSHAKDTQPGPDLLQAQDGFEDSELSPIRNVLSSTITDGQEKPDCTVDSVPTLLWDTYDFHNAKQDGSERLMNSLTDISLGDWDFKEQEGLREVEEILDRAAGILEEEESVLVQAEMLDVLVKTENGSEQWPLCGIEEHQSQVTMSSSDLMEAGVYFEDGPIPADAVQCRESVPLEFAKVAGDVVITPDVMGERPTGADLRTKRSRCNLLQELRGLHVLEDRIKEENFKIQALRRFEAAEKNSFQDGVRSLSQERQMFLRELEREKREVEKMEKSLDGERDKGCKVKNRLCRGRKVVKCSLMERTAKLRQCEGTSLSEPLSCKGQPHDQAHLDLAHRCINHLKVESTNITLTLHNRHCGKPSRTDSGAPGGNCEPGDRLSNNVPCDTAETAAMSSDHSSGSSVDKKCSLNDADCPGGGAVEHNCTKGDPAHVTSKLLENGEVIKQIMDGQRASLTPAPCPEREAFDPGGCDMVRPPVPKPRKTLHLSKPEESPAAVPGELTHGTVFNQEGDTSVTRGAQVLGMPPKPRERLNKLSTKPWDPLLSPDIGKYSSNDNTAQPSAVPRPAACVAPDCTPTLAPSEGSDGIFLPKLPLSEDPQVQPGTDVAQEDFEKVLEKVLGVDLFPGEEAVPDPSPEEAVVGEPAGAVDEEVFVVSPFRSSEHLAVTPVCRSPVNELHLQITLEMTDFGTPVVLDSGSGLMKAGFSGQDLPTAIFPTVIGVPKYEEIMNVNYERETFIGHEAQHMRGILALKYPMRHGIVQNWDEMEKVWHHTFLQLRVKPEEHPVLLTEAPMNPRENRHRMVEIMFEAFSVPYTYVAMQPVLALYAAGRTTGVVFESGDGVSHSVPVFEGYSLPHAVQRFTLAGGDVTLHLRKLLQEQGLSMHTSAELEIVREMKEKCCHVAQDYDAELCGGGMGLNAEALYTMPDGQVVSIGTERFRAPEILFKPELIGRDHYGMHESIFRSVLHSDIDLRKSFVGNVVLSGGNTLLAGLPQRLQTEIRKMVPVELRECVRVTSPVDRDFSVWRGGAVLASLPSFASAWISRQEYEEFGPQIVFRKCF